MKVKNRGDKSWRLKSRWVCYFSRWLQQWVYLPCIPMTLTMRYFCRWVSFAFTRNINN